jgi:hypothetical protein
MQTSYTQFAPEAVLGMMTEDFTKYIDTVIPQVAVRTGTMLTADLTVGKVRNAAKLPAAGVDITGPAVLGIVPFDATKVLAPGAIETGAPDWPALRPVPAMRRGRIWVLAESAVLRWTYPFVRFAVAGANTNIGGFRADADTASAVQFTKGIFLTDADIGQLVLLEINIF